jgi:hypothetical protein
MFSRRTALVRTGTKTSPSSGAGAAGGTEGSGAGSTRAPPSEPTSAPESSALAACLKKEALLQQRENAEKQDKKAGGRQRPARRPFAAFVVRIVSGKRRQAASDLPKNRELLIKR